MTIINSMNMPTYVGILLIMFVLSIYSIVKYRKIKEPWKVLIYLAPPEFIVFITNRIIKEYWSILYIYSLPFAGKKKYNILDPSNGGIGIKLNIAKTTLN